MTYTKRLILTSLVLTSGLLAWGCTKPAAATDATQVRALETRVAKLEQDVKATAAARDDLQRRLTASEARVRQEETRAAAAETARDEALAVLKVRTTERDTTQIQFDTFRKTIRELVGQADVAAARPTEGTPVVFSGGAEGTR